MNLTHVQSLPREKSPNKSLMLATLILLSLLWAESTKASPPIQRPINDFVSAQGSTVFSVINGVTVHKFFGFADGNFTKFMLVDFAGVKAHDLGLPAPSITGKIMEVNLGNGIADVTVNLNASNALAYVTDLTLLSTDISKCTLPLSVSTPVTTNNDFCPTLFGYSVKDLLLSTPGSLNPTYADANFSIEFTYQVPAGYSIGQEPLPDVRDVLFSSGYNLLSISMSSSSFGPLRAAYGVAEGTPGLARETQIFISNPGLNKVVIPEGPIPGIVNLKVVGGGTQK